MEIALIGCAALALLFLSFMDRKNAQLKQHRLSLVETTCARLRSLESICLELQQRYRPQVIEQFLDHQIQWYLEELSRYRNDPKLGAYYSDWVRRAGKMRENKPNEPSSSETTSKSVSTGESAPQVPPSNAVAPSFTVETLRDTKYLLKDLHASVSEALHAQLIPAPSGVKLFEAIQSELLAVGIDTYEQAARDAMTKDDLSLAKHCYMMALKRLQGSPLRAKMKKREHQLQQTTMSVIRRLEANPPIVRRNTTADLSNSSKIAPISSKDNRDNSVPSNSAPLSLADKFDRSVSPKPRSPEDSKEKSWQKKRY